MKQNRKQIGGSAVITIAICVMIAIGISIGSAAILSLMTVKESISTKAVDFTISCTQLLASFLCALIAGMQVGKKYAIICGSASLFYCFMLAGITVLFFNSDFERLGLGLVMCMIGSVAACLLCMTRKKQHKKRMAVS